MTQDPLTLYKLIILYMLDNVQFNLTYSQISSFILEREYTNFLNLQQAISELQESELIKSVTLSSRTYFSITEEGRKTLAFFRKRISKALIDDIDAFLAENHMELKSESSVTATYYKLTSGDYVAELSAWENDEELAHIKLSVPAKDLAETVCNNWHQKNQQIYQYLMTELL